MTRLLKRLRRRGKRTRTWRIAFYNEVGGCEVVEVVRRYRPTRKARALLRPECLRFEIEQVASHVSSQDVGACLLRLSKLASGRVRGVDAPVGKGPRRTRPHPGARTKYIAPVEVHGGGSACGFLETGGLWIGIFGFSSGCLFAVVPSVSEKEREAHVLDGCFRSRKRSQYLLRSAPVGDA